MRFRASVQIECPWCSEMLAGDIPLNVTNYKPASPTPDRVSTLSVGQLDTRYLSAHCCPGPKEVLVTTHVGPAGKER